METDETTVSHCLEIVLDAPVMAQVLIYHLGLHKNGITETKMIFASRAPSENDYLVLWWVSQRDIRSLWTNFISFSCFFTMGERNNMYSTSEHEIEHTLTFCWDNRNPGDLLWSTIPCCLCPQHISWAPYYTVYHALFCVCFLVVGTYRGRWTNWVEESFSLLDWLIEWIILPHVSSF